VWSLRIAQTPSQKAEGFLAGVLHLRVVFEGVGVDHVGGFDVDVPRFSSRLRHTSTRERCYPAAPDSLEFCAFPTGKLAKLHE